jgi:hypothetical protein
LIHEPGFKFAINLDTVQFDVFAGSRSGSAWNQGWNAHSNTNPLVAYIPEADQSALTFLVSFHDNSTSLQRFALISAGTTFGQLSQFQFPSTLAPASTPATQISVVSVAEDLYNVLLWFSEGQYQVLQLDLSALDLTIVGQGERDELQKPFSQHLSFIRIFCSVQWGISLNRKICRALPID